jgi:hypothetical protein
MVPNFEEDLHDLDGLRRMLPHLSPHRATPPDPVEPKA